MGIVARMLSAKTLAILAVTLLSAEAGRDLDEQWQAFKTKYAKEYTDEIELAKREAWEDNYHFMEEHNAAYKKGLKTYEVGENEFNDLSHAEFVNMMNGLHYSESDRKANPIFSPNNLQNLPEEVDWRPKGFVTPIKNQKMCGSCWAFSTTGSLEGATFNKTKKLVSLSEQNLVDCSMKEGNHGCFGGLMDFAFKYIKDNNGIDTEESYPYTAKTGKERLFKASTIGATLSSWTDIKKGSEVDLAAAVAVVGPISVGIDAGHRGFQMYRRGIYYEKQCSSVHLDHGVLAVGYGAKKHDDNGKKDKFWIVKNSWGTTWGDKGYINMAKDVKNMCGIATAASFPVV